MATRKYKVNSDPLRDVLADEKQATAELLALGPYRGGAITNEAQLRAGLEALIPAERLLKEFRTNAKAWVDEHGSLTSDGRSWGASTTAGAPAKVSMSLDAIVLLLHECRVPRPAIDRVVAALRRLGVGEAKAATRYGWSKA